MAEGTRLKDLQEAQKKLDQILQTESMKREAVELKLQEQITGVTTDMQDQLMGLNGKFEHLTNTLAAIRLQLLNINKGKGPMEEESILGGPYPWYGSESTNNRNQHSPRNRLQMDQQGIQMINPMPRIEFPKFDRTQPRTWILKCNGYFKLVPNIPDTQKVTLASMHFEGKAALWYQNFITKQGELTWQQFVEVISARFEELKEARIIVEFNKLKQTGSYVDYNEKFEELKACMLLLKNGEYSEEYFIASFISGLSEELQSFIYMFEPTSLQQTIDLGRKQLHTLKAISKKMKNSVRPYSTSYPQVKRAHIIPNQANRSLPPKPPVKLLSASEMAARREKWLCYNCDEPFTIGHRCKHRINYMIMTEEEELSYLQETSEDDVKGLHSTQLEEVQMSLNALAGEDGLTTMRLFGECGEHKLHILIDSGSTLSFIQEATARKLGCKMSSVKPLLVKVANGQRLVSTSIADEFTWTMQGHRFTYPLRVLKNEGCDMILGGDWLKFCTPIELDYERMTFIVTLCGKRVKIQALTTAAECKFISGPSLYKLLHMDYGDEIEGFYLVTNQQVKQVDKAGEVGNEVEEVILETNEEDETKGGVFGLTEAAVKGEEDGAVGVTRGACCSR
ncbi:hypothetical protein DH2020_000675 [Rehmannia glutinosa]|uniref:Ty3 transposon capsid-like protein domain-containing protein n=1 Tax=Rehmannia glutinosa TaxID=99300 RepID=A0ABR0XXH0_REHGL